MIYDRYEAVDTRHVAITAMGIARGQKVYKIALDGEPGMVGVMLRKRLVEFLFANMRDAWYLGNDDTYMVFSPNDLTMALSQSDAETFDIKWKPKAPQPWIAAPAL